MCYTLYKYPKKVLSLIPITAVQVRSFNTTLRRRRLSYGEKNGLFRQATHLGWSRLWSGEWVLLTGRGLGYLVKLLDNMYSALGWACREEQGLQGGRKRWT